MSTGIKVFAPDGTVILDSTMHVWSLAAVSAVPAFSTAVVNIPPEAINSDIEVVITKLSGDISSRSMDIYTAGTRFNYGPFDGVVEYVDDSAVKRLTELFFDRTNQYVFLRNADTNIPNMFDVANGQLIYQIFNPYVDRLADAYKAVGYNTCNQAALDKIYDSLDKEGAFRYKGLHGIEFIARNNVDSRWTRDYKYGDNAYGEVYSVYDGVFEWVKGACYMSGVYRYISDDVLNVRTPVVSRNSLSRTINVLPTWTLSKERSAIIFNADGTCDTVAEVYVK
jgi:hypothetical protein